MPVIKPADTRKPKSGEFYFGTFEENSVGVDMRNPLNFTRAEWQQAKRVHHDPRLIKAMFRECWQGSDNAAALGAALADKGYYLARGDRRGVVAVDWRGEVYALARWSGAKAKDVRARIPDAESLPSVEETRRSIAVRIEGKLKTHMQEVEAGYARLGPSIEFKRQQLVQRHRDERRRMNDKQEQRWQTEVKTRTARLPRGMGAIWSRVTGRSAKIRRRNEYEAFMAYRRDLAQKDVLIARQLEERQKLQSAIRQLRARKARDLAELRSEIADYLGMRRDDLPKIESFNEKARPKIRTRDRGRTRIDGPDFEPN